MEHLSLISEPGTFPSKQSGAVTNAGHELCKNLTNDDTGVCWRYSFTFSWMEFFRAMANCWDEMKPERGKRRNYLEHT